MEIKIKITKIRDIEFDLDIVYSFLLAELI